MSEWVALESGAEALIGGPDGQARGAVVVGSELFGLTDYIRGVVDRFARAGYVAAAPDFYWRGGRRVSLTYDGAGREAGFALAGALEPSAVVADVAAARKLVRTRAQNSGGTAMVGFSIGGHIGVLAATQVPFDLVVSIYGAWTLNGGGPIVEDHPPLDDAEAIAGFGTTVLGVVGDQDHVISQAEWHHIGARLTEAGVTHELVTYPGLPHGFLCPDRLDTYNAAAADDVWQRMLDVLEQRVAAPT